MQEEMPEKNCNPDPHILNQSFQLIKLDKMCLKFGSNIKKLIISYIEIAVTYVTVIILKI